MSYFCGTISHGSTGVKTVAVGFTPVGMRITVGANGASQAVSHRSVGFTNGTNVDFNSEYSDGSGSSSWQGTGKLVSHYERVAGTLTEKVAATFDSFTATQVKYNVTTADAAYTFAIEAWS